MMAKNYGRFENEPGVYSITKLPESGAFEYFYKNKNILLKVDQFGPSFIQINPPSGMKVLLRKEREIYSPWLTYFSCNNKVYNNFDIHSANKFVITFKPDRCVYNLSFKSFDVVTALMIDYESEMILSTIKFINKTNKSLEINCLNVLSLEAVDSSMAVWDKREWYLKTSFNNNLNKPLFISKHLSVNGNKNERKNVFYSISTPVDSIELSYEKLINKTNNFHKIIPLAKDVTDLFAYEQVCSSFLGLEVKKEASFKTILKVTNDIDLSYDDLKNYFDTNYEKENSNNLLQNFSQLTSLQSVQTKDVNFNKFVNEFLPQELSWVIDLDRGWPTGMRGSRDCANDFLAYINYDQDKTKEVILSLLKSQRYKDGWFPRQIPVGGSNKYDMREFVDSGCFVIELIYEYLAKTDNKSLLEEQIPYLNSDVKESGLEHIIKAAKFYTLEENIGEHGLIKLKGGDWLDCLNRVGLLGRGETLMVTCQAIYAFNQVKEILSCSHYDSSEVIKLFDKYSSFFKTNIKKHCLTNEGFYRSLFSDDGNWYFSEKDIDGEKRIYVPSNSYAVVSDVHPSNNKKVINAIMENNESPYGYKLFTKPFGVKPIDGLGKMGTGDFLPNMLENGAIYNHGSQLFLLRALAKVGDHINFYKVLNYALPYNQKFHSEKDSCAPMYAVTNCYLLVPYFLGRSGMTFLTGSIAMIMRSIYNWMFGINFNMNSLLLKPCLPKQYEDSIVNFKYKNKNISVKYKGFGNKIKHVLLNNNEICFNKNGVEIDKKKLERVNEIIVMMN